MMTVREAPHPSPLACGLDDASHPDSSGEPVLAIDQIQGNILAGFNKDFQTLIFLHIDRGRYFKRWLASQVDFISTTAEVLARHSGTFADIKLFPITAIAASWDDAQSKFFAEGGVFDGLYKPAQ